MAADIHSRVSSTNMRPFRLRISMAINQRQDGASRGNTTDDHSIHNSASYRVSNHLEEESIYIMQKDLKKILHHAYWSAISKRLRNAWKMLGIREVSSGQLRSACLKINPSWFWIVSIRDIPIQRPKPTQLHRLFHQTKECSACYKLKLHSIWRTNWYHLNVSDLDGYTKRCA